MADAEDTARTLRVGLVGAGMISRHHLIAWERADAAEVVAICDPDRDRARARAGEHGIEHVHGDVDAMLEAATLDVVDVVSPRETHAEMVRAAVGRGLDVMCQKPLCPTLAEARALVSEVGERVRLMVHENWRFRPWYRCAHRWLGEGRLGEVRQARMSVFGAGLLADAEGRYPALERQPFFRNERRLLIAESLIHHIDVLRWLLGPLRVLAARTARGVPVVAGETLASILLETAEGAPVVLEANLSAHGYAARATDALVVIGARDTLTLEGPQLRLAGDGKCRETFDADAGYQASFDAAIAHFLDCLRRQTPFETGASDNLETLALVEALYAAADPSA